MFKTPVLSDTKLGFLDGLTPRKIDSVVFFCISYKYLVMIPIYNQFWQ